jgi:hypothetical protein
MSYVSWRIETQIQATASVEICVQELEIAQLTKRARGRRNNKNTATYIQDIIEDRNKCMMKIAQMTLSEPKWW